MSPTSTPTTSVTETSPSQPQVTPAPPSQVALAALWMFNLFLVLCAGLILLTTHDVESTLHAASLVDFGFGEPQGSLTWGLLITLELVSVIAFVYVASGIWTEKLYRYSKLLWSANAIAFLALASLFPTILSASHESRSQAVMLEVLQTEENLGHATPLGEAWRQAYREGNFDAS